MTETKGIPVFVLAVLLFFVLSPASSAVNGPGVCSSPGGDPLVKNTYFGADIDAFGSMYYPTQGFLFPMGTTTQGYAHTPWVRYEADNHEYSYRGRFAFVDGTLWSIVEPLHVTVSDGEKTVAAGQMMAGALRLDITVTAIANANWVLEEYVLTNTRDTSINNLRFYQFVDFDVGPAGIGSGVEPDVISENDDDIVRFSPELNALYTADTDVKNPTPGTEPLVMGIRSPLPSTSHDVYGDRYFANPAYYHLANAQMNDRNVFPEPGIEAYSTGDGAGTLMWDFGTLLPGESVRIPVYFFGAVRESLVGLVGNEAVFEQPLVNWGFVLKQGTTLPVKFHLVDDNNSGNTRSSVEAASLEITGEGGASYTFAVSDGSLRFDSSSHHYVANFNTKTHPVREGRYTAVAKISGIPVGSIPFEVSAASAGTSRTNRKP